jgi:anthranilate phosphoribosyltransferase
VTASIIGRILDGSPLRAPEIRSIFETLIDDGTSDSLRAGILVGLAARAPTVTELVGFAREMRARATPFPVAAGRPPIDLCGSGGARRPSFNVSTVAAFVVAASGTPVAKHGNRSARGPCGSSDLLEALGLPVTTSITFARASYRACGLAFLHAPLFHPATHAVVAVRKTLGIPTLFNRLGPLTNPAHVPFQVVGLPDEATMELVARALPRLGVRRGIALTSAEGCDEFSPRATTHAIVWTAGRSERRNFRPEDYLPPDDRRGDWGPLLPLEAAGEAERLLAGGGGARRGSVLLTAGAAIWTAGRARNLADGIESARTALDGGSAEHVLDRMRRLAQQFRSAEGR